MVGIFVVLFAAGTLFIAGFIALVFAPDQLNVALVLGAAVGLLFSLASLAYTYLTGPERELAEHRARPLRKDERPELHRSVEELAQTMGIPKPQLWWSDLDELEAFTSERDADHAVVMISRGASKLWTAPQLRAVLGHELAHVKNADLRVTLFLAHLNESLLPIAARLRDLEITLLRDALASIWATIAAGISLGHHETIETRDHRGRVTRYTRTREDSGTGMAISMARAILGLLFAAVLLPIALVASLVGGVGWLTTYAVSRQREELADASSAAYTKDPGSLADALERIFEEEWARASRPQPLEYVFVQTRTRLQRSCFTPELRESFMNRFSSTHPEHIDRVRRLRKLAAQMAALNP